MSPLRNVLAGLERAVWSGVLLAAAIVTFSSASTNAQDYPNRPVTIILPYSPGGIPDGAGRLVAEKLTQYFGKPFIVKNRPGAGGTIGTDSVVKSEADGYTLLLGASGTLTISPTLYKNMPFKQNELVPISLIGAFDFVMLTEPALVGKTLRDIVDMAKTKSNLLSIASSGFGSEHHLLIEHFKSLSGAPLLHVPYQGFGLGVVDVMANRVELMFGSTPAAATFVEGKKLGALAVTGDKRSNLLPDVPTFSELGYPDIQMVSWIGLLAPAGSPKAIIDELSAAMEKVLHSDEFEQKLTRIGLSPMASGRKLFPT